MTFLSRNRTDGEKAIRTAEAELEAAMARMPQPVVQAAVNRVREYAYDIMIETPPTDVDLKVIVEAYDNTLRLIDMIAADINAASMWTYGEVVELLCDIRKELTGDEIEDPS